MSISSVSSSYLELLESQKKRAIHPLYDTIESVDKISQTFLKVFLECYLDEREQIVWAPLFPSDTEFVGDSTSESIETACPIHYVMYSANKVALSTIAPYLKKDEWLGLTSYKSTLMHCIIIGIQRGSPLVGGDPMECAKLLLQKAPVLATQKNGAGSTPLDSIMHVREEALFKCNNAIVHVADNLIQLLKI